MAASYSSRFRLPKKAENQFIMGHDQRLDINPELEPDAASFFLSVSWTQMQHLIIYYFYPKMDDPVGKK